MTEAEMKNGLMAMKSILRAYQALKYQANDPAMLRKAAESMIETIHQKYPGLAVPNLDS